MGRGFNSWNRWHCWVDEHKLKETADQLVALKLAEAGYRHLNIDGARSAIAVILIWYGCDCAVACCPVLICTHLLTQACLCLYTLCAAQTAGRPTVRRMPAASSTEPF
jgi:hypothetical protein